MSQSTSKALKVSLVVGLGLMLGAFLWSTVGPERNEQISEPEKPKTVNPVSPTKILTNPAPPSRPRRAATLWRTLDERTVDVKPPFDDGWSKAGRILVDVSEAATAARTWRTGDRVGFEIPQLGERFEAPIDRIDRGPGYASAARGLATDANGNRRRFVVTVGPGRVFAYVDTAGGPYELVGNDRMAWLLPSSSMLAGFDFSKPDYILPDAPRRRPKVGQAR